MKIKLTILAMCLLMLLAPQSTSAQTGVRLTVEPGFDGYYKVNSWTPMRVTASNQGSSIVGAVRIIDNNPLFNAPQVNYYYPLDLPTQSRKSLTVYVPLRGQLRLQVELVDEQNRVIRSEQVNLRPVQQAHTIIGVVSNDPSLLSQLAEFDSDANLVEVAVAQLNLDQLPSHLRGWEGLDLLVFNDVDTSALTTEQRLTLNSWLHEGGNLLVGGGPNASQTVAGLQSMLSLGALQLDTLPHPLLELERFARFPIAERGPYVAAVPEAFLGQVVVQERDMPLIIRQPRSFGQVIYTAFDLNLAPLDQLFNSALLHLLLGGADFVKPTTLPETTNLDQLQTSLSVLSNQTLTSPYWICILMFVYVLFVGPINYVVLRWLKRGEWAWVTVPSLVMLFSILIYIGGFSLRGTQPILSQLTLIESLDGQATANVTSYVGVYSPRRTAYTLESEAELLVAGLPNSLGVTEGLQVVTAGRTTINNLRADIGGQPGVVVYGTTAAPSIKATVRYEPDSQRLAGSLINEGQTPLRNVSLIVMPDKNINRDETVSIEQTFIYEVGDLPVGSTAVEGTAVQRYGYSETFYRAAYLSDSPPLVSRDIAAKAIFLNDEYRSQYERPLRERTLYLVGWLDDAAPPLPVQLTSHSHRTFRQTIMVVKLPLE